MANPPIDQQYRLMGRIQSDVGLITGIEISNIVDQLLDLSARPKKLLVARNETLQKQQVAVTELSALLASVRYVVQNLGKDGVYQQKNVASSNQDVLAATLNGDPALGTYRITPLRTAQSQQLLSSGVKSKTDPLGGGTLAFRFGATVSDGVALDALRGGQGIEPGAIRITDRSGATAQIDLSGARTIDDVLKAVNGNAQINVTAVARGDRIELIDGTGQSASNLRVQEVAGGGTAASLGLAGIDVAESTATGDDILSLSEDLDLRFLNDGNGVSTDHVLADVAYELRDGTTGTIDFSPIVAGTSKVDAETTLGDVLEVVNGAAPGKLRLDIAADGDRLVLTDLTEGEGTFAVSSLYSSSALADLGLDGPATGGAITGRRLVGGLQTVLLSSLNGGSGWGQLGSIQLTDRGGATDTVDVSGAETLEQVIEAINAAAVQITARVNDARNGIELIDATGLSTGDLIVANADGTATADKLGIAVAEDTGRVNSGDLHRKVIGNNTRLSDWNGGAGVARGTLTIRDSSGREDQLNLSQDGLTVRDAIREINRLAVQVRAELNETGDGIRIVDLAGGSGPLAVIEGNSTTAADLRLLGGAVTVEVDGEMTQVIDGSTTYTIQLGEADSLEDLAEKLNALGAGVEAAIFFDGSTNPHRLLLQSQRSGSAGRVLFDASGLGLSLRETLPAQDALVMFGEPGTEAGNVLISSSSNTFNDLIDGLSLQIKGSSDTAVTVTVGQVYTNLSASVKTMVDNYNKFRQRLRELTRYDAETDTRGTLTGDSSALRLDADLSYLLSGTFAAGGSIQSLRQIGIELQDDGTLEFDSEVLQTMLHKDPEAVRRFFADEESGLSAKLGRLIDRLSEEEDSLLAKRLESLSKKIENNEDKIARLQTSLEKERERLLTYFYRLETTVAKLRSNLTAIESFTPVEPYWKYQK